MSAADIAGLRDALASELRPIRIGILVGDLSARLADISPEETEVIAVMAELAACSEIRQGDVKLAALAIRNCSPSRCRSTLASTPSRPRASTPR